MMDWKITIQKVNNGYILKTSDEHDNNMVFEETDNELEAIQNVLNYVQDFFGYYGSKHDSERLITKIIKQ
jgi:hypothetical protein